MVYPTITLSALSPTWSLLILYATFIQEQAIGNQSRAASGHH